MSFRIEDTNLSRQRRWQLRKRAEGKCVTCGRLREGGTAMHCAKHAVLHNKYCRDARLKRGI